MTPQDPSEWEKQRARSLEELGYPALSHDLAGRLLDTLNQWEAGPGADLNGADRQWRIAEALHLLSWLRPLAHSPLCLLLDEERIKAAAPARFA